MGPEVDSIHIPTQADRKEFYTSPHDDAYDIAVTNSIDASFGQRQVLDGPTLQSPFFSDRGPKLTAFSIEQMKKSDGFMKNDSGKNMLSLIDPDFVLLLGDILTFGAKKYAPNNWKKCEDTSRYKDALLRHVYAYLAGETVDPESGLSHLGHAAFGLMCLNYFDNKEQN